MSLIFIWRLDPTNGSPGQVASINVAGDEVEWRNPGEVTAGTLSLDDLTDVDLTGQVEGDILGYVSGNWVPIEPPSGGGTVPSYSYYGGLTAFSGQHRWYNDTGLDVNISSVRASVGTSSTGLPIIIDVHKNASTIFTTQANRPTIAIGAFTATGVPDVTIVAAGEYLTVDIDQVGSGISGANLVVQINT